MDTDYAERYARLERDHWWWVGRRKILRNSLQALPIARGGAAKPTLLEVGCGAGYNVRDLQQDYDCRCLEPDDLLRAQAAELLDCRVEFGMLPDQVGAYDCTFDVVLLMDVLEHVEQDAEALAAIRSLLKPGGFLVLNVPALQWMWSHHDTMNQHFRRYHRGPLMTLLQEAGFDVQTLRYWGHGLIPPAYLARRLNIDSGTKDSDVMIPAAPVNTMMQYYVRTEAVLTSITPWFPGLSLFGIARNPEFPA